MSAPLDINLGLHFNPPSPRRCSALMPAIIADIIYVPTHIIPPKGDLTIFDKELIWLKSRKYKFLLTASGTRKIPGRNAGKNQRGGMASPDSPPFTNLWFQRYRIIYIHRHHFCNS